MREGRASDKGEPVSTRFRALFGSQRPLVGVVHLPPSLGYPGCPGLGPALDVLDRDLDALITGGVDAVLCENDNDKPHTLAVSKAQVAWLARLMHAARTNTGVPLGIGVQRIDWEAALSIASACALDFVRLDVFVDRVRMLGQVVEVAPDAVRALRARLGADRVALFTDVHVKHADLVDDEAIEHGARRASEEGSDAILVTGDRTGEPPSIDDLDAARRASATPVLIGSGLSAARCGALAPHADGALVGTAIKLGDRIDSDRTRELVTAWRGASGSLR